VFHLKFIGWKLPAASSGESSIRNRTARRNLPSGSTELAEVLLGGFFQGEKSIRIRASNPRPKGRACLPDRQGMRRAVRVQKQATSLETHAPT